MSELRCSSASPKFSTLLLYFSYFIFFFPYLLKLISFLSPLFITTSLFLLTFVFSPQFSQHSILNFIFLRDQVTPPFFEEDELEAYKVIFGASDSCDHIALHDYDYDEDKERVVEVVIEDANIMPTFEKQDKLKLESGFTKEPDKLVVKKVEEDIRETESNSRESHLPISKVKAISQRFETKLGNNDRGGVGEFSPSSRTLSNLGSCGSIRRDKEWKRTLACKLFEERHNNSAERNEASRKGEGMDLLWETYDAESTKYSKASSKKNTCRPNVKEEEEEDDEDGRGELCCLQALKFSGGKMNLGMKKPSLVKISKAIKGIRWVHHLTSNGKGKKGSL